MSELTVHPEATALIAEIEHLRDELATALADLERLHTIDRPYLLALYQQKVGAAELECLKAQCRAEWLRRYVEHVQAAKNRGQTPQTEHIEAALQQELSGFWDRLRESADKVTAAQKLMSHLMTPEQTTKLKQLYRQLVKRLHPDVNPEQGDREKLLWRQTQQAYTDGDLDALRTVQVALKALPADAASPTALEGLKAQKIQLLARIRSVREKFEALERTPPYSLKANLMDEAWVSARQAEIETQRQQWLAKAAQLELHLGLLLGDQKYGFLIEFSAN